MISVYASIIVQIKSLQKLLTDHNLLFELKCKLTDIYTSIIDHTLISIKVQNASDKAVIISHYISLDWIVEYKVNSCFLISLNLLSHAEHFKSINWVKTTFQTLLAVSVICYVIFSITVESEHKLSNSITVYEQITAAVTALNKVVNQYSSLWEDNSNMTDVLKNE